MSLLTDDEKQTLKSDGDDLNYNTTTQEAGTNITKPVITRINNKNEILTITNIDDFKSSNSTINRASFAALDLQLPSKPIDSKPIILPKHLSHLQNTNNNNMHINNQINSNSNSVIKQPIISRFQKILMKGLDIEVKEEPEHPIIQRRYSDGIMTSLASIEVLQPATSIDNESKLNESGDIFVPAKNSEVIVPDRKALTKMPFFSTPLTVEATANAYRDFYKRLTDMGFAEQAEAAIVQTNAESVEAAIEYILQNGDSLWHRFVPTLNNDNNNDSNDKIEVIIKDNEPCSACSMAYSKHLINEKGEAIEKKNKNIFLVDDDIPLDIDLSSNENITLGNTNNDDELPDYNDNRLSMSVNTKKRREIQKKELDDALKNRLKFIDDTENKEPEESYKGPKKTCGVCLEDLPESEFYKAPCNHDYCKTCLQSHYKIKTRDGDVLKLSCIEPDCDREILEDEILHFLTDKELLDKFKKFKRDKLVMLNPNARFCCKPNCDGYMIGSRLRPKLKCGICGTFVCYNCSAQWHGYFVGCNANTDMGYAKWALNKDVQKCPKCRVKIEKSDGCNHMTCWSCKHEFCWICKGPYNDAHFAWWNILGCPGGQDAPTYCRCPPCFPSWMNRLIILMCFLGFIVPLSITAAIFWMLLLCLVFCIKCDFKCEIDPCNIFD